MLHYSQIAPRVAFYGKTVEGVLSAFDGAVEYVADAPRIRFACTDPDDQHFLDLASQHQALLISKDKAVLKLRKRVAGLGATVGNILLAEQEEALAACAQASARDDALAYRDANDHFHDLIYAACRNETLVDQIRALRTRCAAYTANRFDSPGRMQRSAREHTAITEALLRSDPAEAQAAMLVHISIGGSDFAEFVSGLPQDLLHA